MSWYNECRLENVNAEYSVVIYLNPQATEFSDEFFSNIKENVLELDEQIKKLASKKFPDIKISYAKIMLGTIMIATVPFVSTAKVEAATAVPATSPQTQAQPYYITKLATTGVVTASKLNVRQGPSINYSIVHVLWNGNKVKVIGESGNWIEIQLSDGRIGWVSKAYIKLAAEPTLRQQKIDLLLNSTFNLIGTPYVWGGRSLNDGGFDCSGLTQYVFSKVGYVLPRVTKDQATQGTNVLINDLQPGDLIFFSIAQNGIISHVGIFIGDGKMIHSPSTGDTVKISDITTSYWQSRIITARRIIQ